MKVKMYLINRTYRMNMVRIRVLYDVLNCEEKSMAANYDNLIAA